MMSKISVIIPLFNQKQYIGEAIDSVLNQTYPNIEIIVVNDGSTDNSVHIIESYHDIRIKLVNNPINIGLTKALNRGIELAGGRYIARMDADDICSSVRLERQVNFMDANNNVGICGTWLQTIEENKTIWKPPIEDNFIRCSMIFENVL